MKLRSVRQLKNLKGKRVLLRVDFNVAVVKGNIPKVEWEKIEATVPTIDLLRKQGAVVVVITHLGRPEGKRVVALSTKAFIRPLSRLLHQTVTFIPEATGTKALDAVKKGKPGAVFLFENIRFHAEEEKNIPRFAKALAALGEVYVNDAFAVSHRKHASVSAITKYLPSYAGLLLEKEVTRLEQLLNPHHPFIVIMGGAKISTKIPVIRQLLPLADVILLGGALANTAHAARGIPVGRSLIEKKSLGAARRLLGDMKVELPIDVRVLDGQNKTAVRFIDEIKPSDRIMDIGPETVVRYQSIIDHAQTIVWNGPLGVCEDRRFCRGTQAIAEALIARSRGKPYGVVGGGDTIPFVASLSGSEVIDFISTGGGAMLEYLSGKQLPGLKPLYA